jgi:hypothetical protein
MHAQQTLIDVKSSVSTWYLAYWLGLLLLGLLSLLPPLQQPGEKLSQKLEGKVSKERVKEDIFGAASITLEFYMKTKYVVSAEAAAAAAAR